MAGPRTPLVCLLALALTFGIVARGALETPAAAAKVRPSVSARSLGAAHNGSIAATTITVPDVAPAADRLLFVWVVHRRLEGTTDRQEIVGIEGLDVEWTKEFHTIHPTNLTRFALFSAVTGSSQPAPGDLTVTFSSESTRTNVLVVEIAGADLTDGGANAIAHADVHVAF